MKITVINGPNLNMLGKREPHIYGSETLEDINAKIRDYAAANGAEVEFFQSNCEGAVIDRIHSAKGACDGLIINAGAYTHYSYAIADALAMLDVPVIEVHISNVHKREEFRHKSVISPYVTGIIAGLGSAGYILAMKGILMYADKNR